jgi:hypothetical protein
MQTWATRGVRAALVTGGMLAVGKGGASTARPSPDCPAQPLGSRQTSDGLPRHSGPRMSGELFPDDAAWRSDFAPVHHRSGLPRTLSGILEPLQDVLAAVEHAPTQEIPAVGHHRRTARPGRRLELAGWVVDTSKPGSPHHGDPDHDSDGQSSIGRWPGSKHAVPEIGTPAEGFHRSLGWAGRVGEVIERGAGLIPADSLPADPGAKADQALVAGADGIVGGHSAIDHPGLLTPESIDLISGEVAEPRTDLHRIPNVLLTFALSTTHAPEPPAKEYVPLFVPGEYQEQANERPKLSNLAVPEERESGRADGQPSAPGVSRITEALERTLPGTGWYGDTHAPAFSATPLNAPVLVNLLDDLAIVGPETRHVTENPFRSVAAPRAAAPTGMALPLLGADITAVSRETLPINGRS